MALRCQLNIVGVLATASEVAVVFFAKQRCADVWQIGEIRGTHD
jgi:hypothetical protein